jgi:hypothetical protein
MKHRPNPSYGKPLAVANVDSPWRLGKMMTPSGFASPTPTYARQANSRLPIKSKLEDILQIGVGQRTEVAD